MKQIVLRYPKQIGQLFIVSSHDLCFGWGDVDTWDLTPSSADLQNVVNVLYGTEAFGVQTKGGSGFKLNKTCLEVKLDGFGSPSFPSSNLRMRRKCPVRTY